MALVAILQVVEEFRLPGVNHLVKKDIQDIQEPVLLTPWSDANPARNPVDVLRDVIALSPR
nr:hypothetical protein [Polyangium jinanense]